MTLYINSNHLTLQITTTTPMKIIQKGLLVLTLVGTLNAKYGPVGRWLQAEDEVTELNPVDESL